MPNDELFSGIPSLDDAEGLEDLLNQQTVDGFGLNTDTPPAMQQVQQQSQQDPAQPQQPQVQQPAQQPQQFTSEQISQIIEQNRQLQNALVMQQQQQRMQQPVAQRASQPVYNERQLSIIKQLLDRGVALEDIQRAMSNARTKQPGAEYAMMQRLQNVEQMLQQQAYNNAEAEFEQKMLNFGEKFGLSEQDLVTFGNAAMAKGINVVDVTDLEAVFRAIYPEQYALRVQRMSNNPTSQIYGGVNMAEAPRAAASKLEAAYVDAFMKQTMPNQYNIHKK